jgi:predicted aminopeptidase
MAILIAALVLFAGYGTAYVASADIRYLTRAGLEQTRILRDAEPLERMADDPDVPPEDRAYLRLVMSAREHAESLGLDAGETYTTYTDIGRDTLLLSLTASRRDCICPVTWKYPIVGRIPYKGFFDPAMGQREADKLAARGFDVSLRPAAAYSTLGWFNDPLLSTALVRDSVELAALVFHEMAHNTLYVKSASPFNESFASMVGYRAAESFFRSRGDSALADRARDRWLDEMVLADYYRAFIDTLTVFYDGKPSGEALDAGRRDLAQWSRIQLEQVYGPRLLTYRVTRLAERPLNNAQLVGVLIYRTHLDWFDRWFLQQGGDLRAAVSRLRSLMDDAQGDAAFERLESALAPSPGAESTR